MVEDQAQTWAKMIQDLGITEQDIQEICKYKHSDESDRARDGIVFLYSLETDMYKDLNHANQCHDTRYIDTLGSYAQVLYCVLEKPSKKTLAESEVGGKPGENKEFTLFRGLGLPK